MTDLVKNRRLWIWNLLLSKASNIYCQSCEEKGYNLIPPHWVFFNFALKLHESADNFPQLLKPRASMMNLSQVYFCNWVTSYQANVLEMLSYALAQVNMKGSLTASKPGVSSIWLSCMGFVWWLGLDNKKCLPVFTSDVCLLVAGLCELFIGPQPGHWPHPGSRHGLDRRRGGDPKELWRGMITLQKLASLWSRCWKSWILRHTMHPCRLAGRNMKMRMVCTSAFEVSLWSLAAE